MIWWFETELEIISCLRDFSDTYMKTEIVKWLDNVMEQLLFLIIVWFRMMSSHTYNHFSYVSYQDHDRGLSYRVL